MLLREWEEGIAERFGRIELIGELDIGESDLREIGPQFRARIDKYGQRKGLGTLLRHYHRTWMTYLVFQGVYGYSDGDYWSTIADDIGVHSGNQLSTWGLLFLQSLERFDLPTFPHLHGPKYVTRILLHGGIPQSSLPNFFEHFLEQPMDHPELATHEPVDLIDHVLTYTSARYALLKPVRRFLANGGDMATDMVGRSLEMAKGYSSRGLPPSADEVGLPERVIAAYRTWVADRSISVRSSSYHLKRPQVRFDPYGDGIYVILPSQRLENSSYEPNVKWTVHLDRSIVQHTVRTFRRQNGWQSEEDHILLSNPYSECQIGFSDGHSIHQVWRLSGLDSTQPMMVFDMYTAKHVPICEHIPVGQYWIVHPKNVTVAVEKGRMIEDAGSLPWNWYHYNAELWDISNAPEVTLQFDASDAPYVRTVTLPVQASLATLQPYLVGGDVVNTCQAESHESNLYASKLPLIHIPVPANRIASTEISRWRFTVSDGNNGISESIVFDVNSKGISIGDSCIEINLVDSGLICDNAFGQYTLSLRGPLGRDTVLTFVAIPQLAVRGSQHVRVAEVGKQIPPGELLVSVAPLLELNSDDNDVVVTKRAAGQYGIELAPECATGVLRVSRQSISNGAAPVDTYIRISSPVLKWTVLDKPKPIAPEDWQSEPILRSRNWLEQAENPQIIVSLIGAASSDSSLSGCLAIYDRSYGLPHILEPASANARHLRYQLSELLDTIRNSPLASIRGGLELRSLGDYHNSVSLDVLRLTTELQVKGLYLESQAIGERYKLCLKWRSMTRLTNRCVRLWSMSKPWAEPIELLIPDEAEDCCEWTVDQEMVPPGRYRTEVDVVDMWASVRPERPMCNSESCIDVPIGHPAQIFVYASKLPATMKGYLERALLATSASVRSRELLNVSRSFCDDDIPFALEVMMKLNSDLGAEATVQRGEESEEMVLQSLLLDSPSRLFKAVAEMAVSMSASQQLHMRRLLIGIGIGSCCRYEMQEVHGLGHNDLISLWACWPFIAVIAEGHNIVRGNRAAWNRSGSKLGLHTYEKDLEDRIDLPIHHLVDLTLESRLREGPPEQTILRLPSQRLQEIRRQLGIVPGGLLAPEQWLLANFDWLLACKNDPDKERFAVSWVQTNIEHVCAALQTLIDDALTPVQVGHVIAKRYDRRDLNPLVNIPFLVGVAALIQRSIGHRPSIQARLHSPDTGWDFLALQANDIAPSLFERDMCMVELMILQQLENKVLQ